mgnify:CR=1 FL=1
MFTNGYQCYTSREASYSPPDHFLRLTLKSVLRVVDPGVLSYLEQARLGFNSIMPLLAEHVSRVYLPDGIFSKDLFVESLQVHTTAVGVGVGVIE